MDLTYIPIILLSFILWTRLFTLYVPDQRLIMDAHLLQLPYSVTLYTNQAKTSFMLHAQPQNIHLFVEDGTIIYQPIHQQSLYCAPSHPNVGYIMSAPPKPVCRKSLTYLKKRVYDVLIYRRLYSRLLNPMIALQELIRDGWISPLINSRLGKTQKRGVMPVPR